ncbi:MAG: methylated-DNA--[protein]-cysteine S-methyltransferase [Pseudomonadota bacterium]
MNCLEFETPLGKMVAIGDDHNLTGLYFSDQSNLPNLTVATSTTTNVVLLETKKQLAAYFGGALQNFTLPVAVKATPFQRLVWDALARIEIGETISYLALARSIGCESSVRAVAQAVARNPLIIITPCHRVIGSDGGLTGYSGGIARKKVLLAFDAAEIKINFLFPLFNKQALSKINVLECQ